MLKEGLSIGACINRKEVFGDIISHVHMDSRG